MSLLPLISIIPKPVSVEPSPGEFTLAATTRVVMSQELANEGRYLATALSKSSGLTLKTSSRGGDGDIVLKLDKSLAGGPESYTLEVAPNKVVIAAKKPAGVFYGAQSLRQLFPAKGDRLTAPACIIKDEPRFAWRGSHLDVSRNFMPASFIYSYLDSMALLKLNTFHWHLTDDQGWRIEIKKYPKLTSVGAWRKDTMLVYSPAKFTGEPHGGFYTQKEIRDIIAYAAARHITIVPEIEMPGHAQAAIAAYPELGNTGEKLDVGTTWGVITHVFNPKESTIDFLKDVLDEVMDLFPSPYIHIGGDECPKDEWKASPFAQAKIAKLGLKNEHELQSWFIRQMDEHITAKGRRLIGWSEILEGGLAPNAALMVWLGDDGAMEAVKSGHNVVMAQTTHTYFDYYQVQDRSSEPHSIGGFLPLNKVYSYEPILPAMTPEQAAHVLGVQYQLWTEYIRTPEHVEYMAFPRGCALAEVAWSPKTSRNFDDFMTRLSFFLDHFTSASVNFRRLDPGK